MMSPPTESYITALLLALTLALAGCTSTEPSLSGSSRQPVDFSGHWEMNYAQSDNIQARLNSLVRELRKQSERRGAAHGEVGGPAISIGGTNNGASVIGLAQMADMITQSAVVIIDQDDEGIQVKREGNFALDCQFAGPDAYRVDSPLGRELCGWDGHQLVFTLLLPDGLSIRHRLTRSEDGQQLNIATTVVSDQVSYPFTLNRVFTRFEPGSAGYRCEMTVTRGRVCTTEAE
ncbi:hypothetical protein FV139_07330 [Parahaliea maris]|uniref:Uncharacterized protein n=1 Tax=Parahaliea maris TaxID=2716870 RepID=A0A5C9A468_9GAMM|nr:hypothetical protein [Parahaliea maris]TXS95673.1 hypothetical protein FV139_07330 [Parahaliea maris]